MTGCTRTAAEAFRRGGGGRGAGQTIPLFGCNACQEVKVGAQKGGKFCREHTVVHPGRWHSGTPLRKLSDEWITWARWNTPHDTTAPPTERFGPVTTGNVPPRDQRNPSPQR